MGIFKIASKITRLELSLPYNMTFVFNLVFNFDFAPTSLWYTRHGYQCQRCGSLPHRSTAKPEIDLSSRGSQRPWRNLEKSPSSDNLAVGGGGGEESHTLTTE